MKLFTIALAIVLLSGCVVHIPSFPKKAPSTVSKASEAVTVEYDKFKDETWIRTPMYLSRQGFTDTFPVMLSYRARYKNTDRSFIQLYIKVNDVDWGFYQSANGEDGYAFEFIDIDSDVGVVANMVTTREHFGLTVPIEYLEQMAAKDWSIKAYGKRNSGVFIVPQSLSKGFLAKIKCHESATCLAN